MTDAIIRQVYYTADLVVPNGSDTSIYGDGCEPGTGADLRSGWYDPDWSRTTVCELKGAVRPDVWDREGDPAVWLAHTLNQRLNGHPEYNGGGTWYAGEEDQSDYRTGITASVAAHAEGFTDAEVSHAEDLLQMVRHGGWLILQSLYGGEMSSRTEWEEWNG